MNTLILINTRKLRWRFVINFLRWFRLFTEVVEVYLHIRWMRFEWKFIIYDSFFSWNNEDSKFPRNSCNNIMLNNLPTFAILNTRGTNPYLLIFFSLLSGISFVASPTSSCAFVMSQFMFNCSYIVCKRQLVAFDRSHFPYMFVSTSLMHSPFHLDYLINML